jgi:Mrp family chromosome partitioning ATPase
VLEAFTSSMQHKSYPYSLVRVITPASPPLNKSSPRTKITLVFGALAGLLLGVGIAIARQSLDGSIRAGRQIRSDLGTDCLVEVPRIRFWANDQRGLTYVCINPRSPFADAIGRLKTAIRINAKANGTLAVGITSALHGEGKSMTASNLGLACVGAGYRTLVVDGDPLRSTLSKSLGLPPDAEASAGPVRPHPGPGWPVQGERWFDLIPARFGHNPGEWARTSPLSGSWRDFQPVYEVVIVDLPPIEQAIDVLPALPALDFLILLAEWGSTPIDVVAEAMRMADAFGTPLLGVVLTKVPRGQRRRSMANRVGGHPIR